MVVCWQASTRTATAYLLTADKFKPTTKLSEYGDQEDTKRDLQIAADGNSETAPFIDKKSGSRFDIAGRCVEGKWKGYCLQPQRFRSGKVVRLVGRIHRHDDLSSRRKKHRKPNPRRNRKPSADDPSKEITGAAEF